MFDKEERQIPYFGPSFIAVHQLHVEGRFVDVTAKTDVSSTLEGVTVELRRKTGGRSTRRCKNVELAGVLPESGKTIMNFFLFCRV